MGDIAINCKQITQTADALPFVSYQHDHIHGAKAWLVTRGFYTNSMCVQMGNYYIRCVCNSFANFL